MEKTKGITPKELAYIEMQATLQAHFDAGHSALCEFRERGFIDVSTKAWYQSRFKTDEEYRTWLAYRFEYEDVSDKYFNSLSAEEKKIFYQREQNRWKFGVWKDLPTFLKLRKDEQEQYRAINPLAGKVQVLSATHYVLLNYLTVEVLESAKGMERPIYFRRDSMLFDIVESIEKYTLPAGARREWLLYFKSRGTHFSTNMYSYIARRMMVENKFNCISSIDVEKKISSTGKKIEQTYRRLPMWCQSFKPGKGKEEPKSLFAKWAGDKQQYGLKLEYWDKDMGEVDNTKHSSVIIRIPKPTSFEQERAHFVFLDEINLYEYNISEVIEKASGCAIGSHGQRVGLIVGGGVSDNNNYNLPKFKAITKNPKANGCFVLFSGIQHYQQVDKSGWTPEADIIERERMYRMELKALSDDERYVTYVTQFPISIDDCFYIKGQTYLDMDVINKHISDVEREIKRGVTTIHRGWLRQNLSAPTMAPLYEPDHYGGWYILEHPDPAVRNNRFPVSDYITASDNVDAYINSSEADLANAGGGRRSQQAMVIIKTATKEPVALYLYRHQDPNDDYRQKLLACTYYNCMILPEKNKPGELNYFMFQSDFAHLGYQSGYFARYLKKTPIRYGISASKATPYGIDTMRTKEQFYKDYYVPYIRDNIGLIKIPRLLEDIAKWDFIGGTSSPDSCMALLICIIFLNDVTAKDAFRNIRKQTTSGKSSGKMPIRKYVNGRLEWV